MGRIGPSPSHLLESKGPEFFARNLKTTLQMEYLSWKTTENLEREIRMHFLLHNFVRRLMLQAARVHSVRLDRISFAGSLAASRRFSKALLQARSMKRVASAKVRNLILSSR